MSKITDVAAAAGVSIATVSRVLNGNTSVAPALAARVTEAADRLGYQPSRVARSLRTRQGRVWFLIVSDIHNPFFTDLVSTIEEVAYSAGHALVLCNAENPLREEAALRLAIAEHASGIVLVPVRPTETDLSAVLARQVPVVVIDQRLPDRQVDRVITDGVAGAAAAVDHLVANGYQRIAYIGGPPNTTTGADRLAGYRQALRSHRRRFEAARCRQGDFHPAGGYREMQALLGLRKRPDAVVIANNMMTIGALRALREARVRIPTELALVSYDETPWAPLIDPPLTTIAQPTAEIGAESARFLLSRIAGFSGPGRLTVFAPTLNVRESSRPLGTASGIAVAGDAAVGDAASA